MTAYAGTASELAGYLGSLAAADVSVQLAGVAEAAVRVVFSVSILILCVTVHEFGHAYVADRLGDPLPRRQGRVTLNPLAHIDLLGTVLFPALMALGAALPLAWGKPVECSENPRLLTRRFSMRTIRLLVSVAGPAMNLALALVLSVGFLVAAWLQVGFLPEMLLKVIQLNLGLLFFNLLPVPPLDGRAFLAFLPDALAPVREGLLRYGALIFLALVVIGGMGQGPSPLQYIMLPFNLITRAYLGWLLQIGGLT